MLENDALFQQNLTQSAMVVNHTYTSFALSTAPTVLAAGTGLQRQYYSSN